MISKSLAFDFVHFLKKGNLEDCRQIIDKYEGMDEKRLKRTAKVMRKTFKSIAHSSGDNILHFVVRLEQSETLKRAEDNLGILPEIQFVYDMVGPEQFLQFLVKKNDKGISPAEEAASSKGKAYESLRAFVARYSSLLRPSFMEGFFGMAAMAISEPAFSILGGGYVDFIIGAGLVTWGVSTCYTGFKKEKHFRKVNRSLSRPVPLL